MSERKPLEIDSAKSPEYCDLCSFGSVKCLVAIRGNGVSFICPSCMNELYVYWGKREGWMSDHIKRQMDRIMDNNEEVESRCILGCGYFGPWAMRGKEIEGLEAEVVRLREAIREHQEYSVLHVYDGELPDIQDRELWATIETEVGGAGNGVQP